MVDGMVGARQLGRCEGTGFPDGLGPCRGGGTPRSCGGADSGGGALWRRSGCGMLADGGSVAVVDMERRMVWQWIV
jgi:hypothetical protein